MTDTVLVLSRRTILAAAAAVGLIALIVLLVLVPGPREAVARVLAPTTTADPAVLAQQRTAAEHSIQRGYAQATGQLTQVRELTLAISKSEADAIDQKARADLALTRRQALVAVAAATAVPAVDVERYVVAVEATLDQGSFDAEPGILLAPSLFDLVRRADGIFAQTADEATRQLTRAPSAAPSARPSPTASPRGSGTASSSPSR